MNPNRDLFEPGLARGLAKQEASAAKHAGVIAELIPVALDLAKRAGREGITTDNIRCAAGLELAGKGRQYSWLAAVPRKAGLIATDRTRRSGLMSTHGRRLVVHVHPDLAGVA